MIVAILAMLFILPTHSFLAMNKPIQADILVVEGWLPDPFLKLAVAEFNSGQYKNLITIGGPIRKPHLRKNYSTHAERAAKRLCDFGLDEKLIIVVPYSDNGSYKTYNSFIALRDWLFQTDYQIKSLNIFTADVHGRKSYISCKKALGEKIDIGVISAKTTQYNPRFWWKSWVGIKLVFRNIIGIFYILCLNS